MDKKMILITGASSGFGLLTSLALAKAGFHVIATMRDLKKQSLLEKKAIDMRVRHLIDIRELDVTDEDRITKLSEEVMRDYGYLDGLINNAGFAQGGLSEGLTLKDYKDQFDTNVFGVISVTQAFLPLLRKSKNGRIINISSISGMIGFPGLSPYVASKHAIEGYSESIRLELKPFNIDVILIEPGSYQTNVWKTGMERYRDHQINDIYQTMNERLIEEMDQVMDRLGDPDDVVRVILHALTTPKPRLRYPVGKGVRLSLLIKRLLPWKLWEWIVKKRLT